MKKIYLDMTRGISGDMFVSASFAFMADRERDEFRKRMKWISEKFDLTMSINESMYDGLKGFVLSWKTEEKTERRGSEEALNLVHNLCDGLGLSENSKRFGDRVVKDILRAEADAHNTDIEEVHLHEIGRLPGIANIASAALCLDLLELHQNELIGSYISIGEGYVDTAHGRLAIPVPAAAFLLKGLRFRFGPCLGEMATPAGIAIVKNAIKSQSDTLPKAEKQGIGFGSRIFDNRRGFVGMFSIASNENGGA